MYHEINTKLEKVMATLEDISNQLTALPAAIAAAVVAAIPSPAAPDNTAIENAINAGFAALTAEIKTNVEGVAPVATPTPAASTASAS